MFQLIQTITQPRTTIESLPPELLIQIFFIVLFDCFGYIHPDDINHLRRVCYTWNNIISGEREFWRDLKLSFPVQTLPGGSIDRYIDNSFTRARSSDRNVDDTHIVPLRLSIDFHKSGDFSPSYFYGPGKYSDQVIEELLKLRRTQLQQLGQYFVSASEKPGRKMTVLRLFNASREAHMAVANILEYMNASATHGTANIWTGCEDLAILLDKREPLSWWTFLEEFGPLLSRPLLAMKNLRTLSLPGSCARFIAHGVHPEIRVLHLCGTVIPRSLKQALRNLPKLKHLKMEQLKIAYPSASEHDLPPFSMSEVDKEEKLIVKTNISSLVVMGWEGVYALAQENLHFPNLRTLTLCNLSDLKCKEEGVVDALLSFIGSLKRLKTLDLHHSRLHGFSEQWRVIASIGCSSLKRLIVPRIEWMPPSQKLKNAVALRYLEEIITTEDGGELAAWERSRFDFLKIRKELTGYRKPLKIILDGGKVAHSTYLEAVEGMGGVVCPGNGTFAPCTGRSTPACYNSGNPRDRPLIEYHWVCNCSGL